MRLIWTIIGFALALLSCQGDLGTVGGPGRFFPSPPTEDPLPSENGNGSFRNGNGTGLENPPLPNDGANDNEPPPTTSPPGADAGPPPVVRPVPKADAMPYADAAPYAEGCPEGGGSGLPNVDAMISHINSERKHFVPHPQITGYPWVGTALPKATWKTVLLKHPELMERAQIFAAELARGGAPLGREYERQFASLYQYRFESESMWLHGLDTPEYRISALSKLGIVKGPNASPQVPDGFPMKWHARDNGTIRQALFYQSGMDPFPTKEYIGVGRACLPNGDVWWVVLVAQY